MSQSRFTVRDLMAALAHLPADAEVAVQGGLSLREVVRCTDERVRIEFDEQIIAAAPEWIVFVAKSR